MLFISAMGICYAKLLSHLSYANLLSQSVMQLLMIWLLIHIYSCLLMRGRCNWASYELWECFHVCYATGLEESAFLSAMQVASYEFWFTETMIRWREWMWIMARVCSLSLPAVLKAKQYTNSRGLAWFTALFCRLERQSLSLVFLYFIL